MNKEMIIMLVMVLTASCCFGLTNEGRLLKEGLRLADFAGPTNRYAWVCPAQVSVSNQTFRIDECKQDGNYFDTGFAMQDGLGVGSCELKITASAEAALDEICDRIMCGCVAPVEAVVAAWQVERDAAGNVLLFRQGRNSEGSAIERSRLRFYRTYGNLYVRIAINTDRVALGAWDFALPMIQAGLQPQQ